MSPSHAPQKPALFVSSEAGRPQPTLQRVLSNLDVNLDREIARYRTEKVASSQATFRPIAEDRQTALQAPTGQTRELSSSKAVVSPPPLPPNPRLQHQNGADTVTVPPNSAVANLVVQPQAPVPPAAVSTQTDLSAEIEPLGLPPASPSAQTSRSWSSAFLWGHSLKTPLGLGALLLLLVTSAGLGFILVTPSAVEHLLAKAPWLKTRTLPGSDQAAENEALVGKPPSPLSPDLSQSEFAPLDPKQLTILPSGVPPVSGSRSPLSAPSSAAPPPADTALTDKATAAQLPSLETRITEIPIPAQTSRDRPVTAAPQPASPAPALSAAALPPAAVSPSAPPTVESTTPPASEAAAPTDAPSAPTDAPVGTPSRSELQPAPQSEPNAPAEIALDRAPETVPQQPTANETAALSAPSSAHYVVADYTGDASLEAARTAVADAYVRNFEAGARIQLGAFGSEAAATRLLEDLRTQGIEAEVFTP